MKHLLGPQYPLLIAVLATLVFYATPAFSQQPSVNKVPSGPTTAISGSVLFKQYCAACHGMNGKGDGPAAPALKSRPGDLTHYATRNSGRFPEEKFMRIMH